MRLSSVRALLFAFVMVMQTVAGGFGVARAMPGGADPGLSAHCGSISANEDGADDTRRDAGRHRCESCLLCAGPPSLSAVAFAPGLLPPRAFQRAGFIRSDGAGAPARIARARLARGPPAVGSSA
jgi:hypothetical protein